MSHKIGAVLVTYNRLDKLKIALQSFESQTLSPEYVLVVNNASTDGTSAFLQKWSEQETNYRRLYFDLKENTGGSGGFYYGLNEAMQLNADWIWISDDDAFPDKDAFRTISNCLDQLGSGVSAVCCTVMNNKNIDTWHRRNIFVENNRIVERTIPEEIYKNDIFELNAFSYVGAVVNKSCLEIVGLTDPEYFIFYDDTEHSLRLNSIGKIICCTRAIVYHDQSVGDTKSKKWKEYYKIRNRYLTYKKHFSKKIVLIEYAVFWKQLLKYSIRKMFGKSTTVTYDALLDSILGRKGKNNSYIPGMDVTNITIC